MYFTEIIGSHFPGEGFTAQQYISHLVLCKDIFWPTYVCLSLFVNYRFRTDLSTYLRDYYKNSAWSTLCKIWSQSYSFGNYNNNDSVVIGCNIYGHLVGIGMLWSFVIFYPFWYIVPRKIWQPWTGWTIKLLPPFRGFLFSKCTMLLVAL
jgi:hypothetical protein